MIIEKSILPIVNIILKQLILGLESTANKGQKAAPTKLVKMDIQPICIVCIQLCASAICPGGYRKYFVANFDLNFKLYIFNNS